MTTNTLGASPARGPSTLRKLIATTGTTTGAGARTLPGALPPAAPSAAPRMVMRIGGDDDGSASALSASGLPTTVTFSSPLAGEEDDGLLSPPPPADGGAVTFDMDAVFPPGTRQAAVWAEVGAGHVAAVLAGYNSTIFAYGRTGSGKTHTVVGPTSARHGAGWSFSELAAESDGGGDDEVVSELGLVPRALHALLGAAAAERDRRHVALSLAAAEIYNRTLYDLLPGATPAPADAGVPVPPGAAEKTEVRDSRATAAVADKLTWHSLDTGLGREDDAMGVAQALMMRANAARVHAATAANADSSRSHVLYLVRVASLTPDGACLTATLSIVDLAGSESLDSHDRGAAVREAETKAINVSLHTLTRVVAAYAAAPPGGRPAHVPYRESLLTLLLKDAIGGNCRTSILVALAADDDQLAHSFKACQFARLARGVRNCAKENKVFDPTNVIAALRGQVAELSAELEAATAAAAADAPDLRLSALATAAAAAAAGGSNASLAAALEAWVGWYTAAPGTDVFCDRTTLLRRVASAALGIAAYVKAQPVWTAATSPVRTTIATSTTPSLAPPPPATPAAPPRADAATSPLTPGTLAAATGAPATATSPRAAAIRSLLAASAMWREAAEAAGTASEASLRAAGAAESMLAGRLAAMEVAAAAAAAVAGTGNSDTAATGSAAAAGGSPAPCRLATSSTSCRSVSCEEARAAGWLAPLPPASSRLTRLPSVATAVWGYTDAAGALVPLPPDVGAALDAATTTSFDTPPLYVLSGTPPVCLTHAGAAAQLAAARSRAETAGWVPTAAGKQPDLPSPHAARLPHFGLDGTPAFVASIIDPAGLQQTCIATGCARPLVRAAFTLLESDLAKRRARMGGWVNRTFRLTTAGVFQLADVGARDGLASSRVAAAAATSGAADAATRAGLAAAAGVAKPVVVFGASPCHAELLLPAASDTLAQRGRLFTITVRGGRSAADVRHTTLCAASSLDAAEWVRLINAVACGDLPPPRIAPLPPAPLPATAAAAGSPRSTVAPGSAASPMRRGRLTDAAACLEGALERLVSEASSYATAVAAACRTGMWLHRLPPGCLTSAQVVEVLGLRGAPAAALYGSDTAPPAAGLLCPPALIPLAATPADAGDDDEVFGAEVLPAATAAATTYFEAAAPGAMGLALAAWRLECPGAALTAALALLNRRRTPVGAPGTVSLVATGWIAASSRAEAARWAMGGLLTSPSDCARVQATPAAALALHDDALRAARRMVGGLSLGTGTRTVVLLAVHALYDAPPPPPSRAARVATAGGGRGGGGGAAVAASALAHATSAAAALPLADALAASRACVVAALPQYLLVATADI